MFASLSAYLPRNKRPEITAHCDQRLLNSRSLNRPVKSLMWPETDWNSLDFPGGLTISVSQSVVWLLERL